jgi:hypothetical protein
VSGDGEQTLRSRAPALASILSVHAIGLETSWASMADPGPDWPLEDRRSSAKLRFAARAGTSCVRCLSPSLGESRRWGWLPPGRPANRKVSGASKPRSSVAASPSVYGDGPPWLADLRKLTSHRGRDEGVARTTVFSECAQTVPQGIPYRSRFDRVQLTVQPNSALGRLPT